MKPSTSWIIVGVLVILIIWGMSVYTSGSSGPGQYDNFAMCIAKSGATFFGAFWCPHCQEQKALFGNSVSKLPYVECSTPDGQGQTQACKDNKIESYPTWQFKDGTRKTGTIPLLELASSTGCALTKN